MQSIQDIKNQVLVDIQRISKELSIIKTLDEFLEKGELLTKLLRLQDFVVLLSNYTIDNQIVNRNDSAIGLVENSLLKSMEIDEKLEVFDNEIISNQNQVSAIEKANDAEKEQNTESITNEISEENNIAKEEICLTKLSDNEGKIDENQFENETVAIDFSELESNINEKIEESIIADNEELTDGLQEEKLSNQIIENQIDATEKSILEEEEKRNDYQDDKKVKLANIKGLQQFVFEDEQKPVQGQFFADTHPKIPKTFKLDLNDKMAFTKYLFDGSQFDLNETVRHLNSFETLEEAKEYLSDMYYEKKWDKVDEYAQRLWSLVENRFL